MTAVPCIEAGQVQDLLELSEADPRRRHARECPRCRALVDSYRLYREPGAPPAEARVEDAEARLRAVMAQAIGAGLPATRQSVTSGPTWIERLFHPALRPAWAFAALAVVLGLATVWPRLQPIGRRVELRGGPTEHPVEPLAFVGGSYGPGGVELRWRAWPGAESYEIEFFSGDLQPIGRVRAMAETSLVVPLERLPFRAVQLEGALVRIHARVGGDVVGSSRAVALGRAQ
jgi:hypothetical protein